jgi:hypothetical protein
MERQFKKVDGNVSEQIRALRQEFKQESGFLSRMLPALSAPCCCGLRGAKKNGWRRDRPTSRPRFWRAATGRRPIRHYPTDCRLAAASVSFWNAGEGDSLRFHEALPHLTCVAMCKLLAFLAGPCKVPVRQNLVRNGLLPRLADRPSLASPPSGRSRGAACGRVAWPLSILGLSETADACLCPRQRGHRLSVFRLRGHRAAQDSDPISTPSQD